MSIIDIRWIQMAFKLCDNFWQKIPKIVWNSNFSPQKLNPFFKKNKKDHYVKAPQGF